MGTHRVWVKLNDFKGTNVLGHFLFTKELLPILFSTAKRFPNSTRVIWCSSISHILAPRGLIKFEDVNLSNESGWARYGQSKAVLRKYYQNKLTNLGQYPHCHGNGTLVFRQRTSYIFSQPWDCQHCNWIYITTDVQDISRTSGVVVEWFLVNAHLLREYWY